MKIVRKVLNLYAGVGGNRKKWQNVEVTAVENNPRIAEAYRELYPKDTLIVAPAHEYLIKNFEQFDFIWSSPPCQSHTRMVKATRHKIRKYPDFRLYEEIIFLQNFCKTKWIVENVKPYYAPLIPPTATLGRHLLWSNFNVAPFNIPTPSGFITKGTVKEANELKKWLGIHYTGNIYFPGNHCPGQVLRNCVHPDMGNHIFKSAFKNQQEIK